MKHSYILSLLAALVFLPFAAPAQCLPGWTYYQPVTINNSLPQVLTNYQVKIIVNTATPIGAGHMQANGNDIRFTTTGCANAHYWIESGMNTASTVIWVKVPSIAASGNTTINMFYGNPAAPAAANGDSTFLFFDDFSGASLNLTKWTVRGTPGSMSQSAGVLTFWGNNNWEYIRSNTTWNGPVVIHTREYNAGVSAAMVLGYAGTDSRYTFRDYSASIKGTTYDPDVSGGNAWFLTNYPAVPHAASAFNDFEVQPDFVAGNIVVNKFCNNTTASCNTTSTPLNSVTGTGYYTGFSSYNGSYVEYVDHIFVRSHVASAPSTTVGAEQATAAITTTSSATMFCLGDSITVNFTPNGTFNAGNVFTAELSDAFGSFTSPIVLGALVSTSTSPQTIGSVIPMFTPAGSQYRIRVNSSNQAITGTDNGINITINALPVIATSVSFGTICNGMSDTITVSGGVSYLWSTSDTSATIIVTPSSTTTYYVDGVDVNGCYGSDTLIVTVNPLPVINVAAAMVEICNGQTDQLFAGGATTYAWSTGDTASTIVVMPSVTTTYTVSGSDVNGCTNSGSITVTVNQLPVVTVVSATDSACNTDGLIALTGLPAGGTWSGPAIIGSDFDPTQAFIGSNSLLYTYTDSVGCSAMDSLSVYVDICLGYANHLAGQINVYPNPNNGMFSITSDAIIGAYAISDISGRVVYAGVSRSTTENIDVENLANGVYFVKTDKSVVKFVIEK